MTTIAEYPAAEFSAPGRAMKIAVIGGGGVGKTGRRTPSGGAGPGAVVAPVSNVACLLLPALVVRFLTRRFIGDYERNAGE